MSEQGVDCYIPARIGSTRFSRKPLALLHSEPLILHTWRRAQEADCFAHIYCVTDSPEIAEVITKAGGEVLFEEGNYASGSDRVYAAVSKLDSPLVLNLQGDEPLINPVLLKQVAQTLKEYPDDWVSAASPLLQKTDFTKKSVVKVQVKEGLAVDFQRLVSDYSSEWWDHRGVYAYSRKNLSEFCKTPPTKEEKSLSLEQWRIFGKIPIRMICDKQPAVSVDEAEDLWLAEKYMQKYYSHIAENIVS
jgi:3-deoxy-manno-octulosonate cytidylyltransferase (CMP-KDO synthetase)